MCIADWTSEHWITVFADEAEKVLGMFDFICCCFRRLDNRDSTY